MDKIEKKKLDHVELASKNQVDILLKDDRFYYEPILNNNKTLDNLKPINFLKKTLKIPMWISSMTGGNRIAKQINLNLAKACKKFGMGMGLGSCRVILNNLKHFNDFKVRKVIGDEQPLFANLGISQVEDILEKNKSNLIIDLIKKLEADGLIIHVNPIQEFLQPEGDTISYPPINTIKKCIDKINYPIIVKEVGQGMGPASLNQLLSLPLGAIELASFGGTNFAKIEITRNTNKLIKEHLPLSQIGHSAEEMIKFINNIIASKRTDILCNQIIISGGIKNYLDGYYYINKLNMNCIYGQASSFIQHAKNSYEDLEQYIVSQIKGFSLCKKILKVKK